MHSGPNNPSRLASHEDWQQQHLHRQNLVDDNLAETQPWYLMHPIRAAQLAHHVVEFARMGDGRYDPEVVPESFLKSEVANTVIGSELVAQETAHAIISSEAVQHMLEMRHAAINSSAAGELSKQLGPFKEAYRRGVSEGVRQGYLPDFLIKKTNDTLRDVVFQPLDPYIAGDTLGQYLPKSDRIEVGAGLITTHSNEFIRELMIHETVHKAGGGTYFQDDYGTIERSRTGFAQGKLRWNKNLVNEFAVQVCAQGIATGDFEHFSPDERKNDRGFYAGARRVGKVFIDKSGGMVTLKDFTRAHFEDNDGKPQTVERRKLMKGVVAAYGHGALNRLDVLMRAAEERNTRQYNPDLSDLYERIHPPELDPDGQVLRAGYIDTENMQTFQEEWVAA